MKIGKLILVLLTSVILVILFTLLARNGNLQLFNPQGYIAQEQSKILFGALILGLCIGIVVVGMVFFVVFHYREGGKSKHSPDWSSSKLLTAAWWTVPAIIILFLSIINWKTAHQLDPYKPIASKEKSMTIQVVALQWKWLFIYPEQGIATVNYIAIPVNRPVHFELTADAPMNSFWIPSLGGQIYAMAGMSTQINLLASKQGDFPGYAAEINGDGFSGMNFTVRSTTPEKFNQWVSTVQNTGKSLTLSSYNELAKPSMYNSRAYYNYEDTNLYNEIIEKFMAPSGKMVMPGMH